MNKRFEILGESHGERRGTGGAAVWWKLQVLQGAPREEHSRLILLCSNCAARERLQTEVKNGVEAGFLNSSRTTCG